METLIKNIEIEVEDSSRKKMVNSRSGVSNEEREEENNNSIASEDAKARPRDGVIDCNENDRETKKRKKMKKGKEMLKDDTKDHSNGKEKKRKRKEIEGVVLAENEANCEVPNEENGLIKKAGSDGSPFDECGLVQGKRFSNEENELIKKAVERYIEAMQLGEEGLDMILECKSHPKVKDCWKVISAALPWRPYISVYERARRLYMRGDSNWTAEEVEFVREFYKKYGPKWKLMADKLGKYHVHVRNAFQRYKLFDLNKGKWSQDEYRRLFELVNEDLLAKVSEEKKSKHGMLKDNIRWEAISDELGTRDNTKCCLKWYKQLTSPMVAQGLWADADDYRLLTALVILDASCEEEVEWDDLLGHRSGELCCKRWLQMSRHLGEHGNKSFSEQVDVLSKRYCPDFAQVREALDARPVVDG